MFTIIGGDGKEYGPVGVERLRQWIAQNRANLNTQARRDGGYYKPLREHPEFAPPPPPAPELPPASVPVAPPAAATPELPIAPAASAAPVEETSPIASVVAPEAAAPAASVAPAVPAAPTAPGSADSVLAPAPAAAPGETTPTVSVVPAFPQSSLPPPPPPPPPPGAPGGVRFPPSTAKPEPIEFTGEWTEYFKIWIVNVLLTIATLGIYAAWAKVRKRRYLYANTRVCGHAFEYLADPVKILIGNLIVGALFGLYSVSPGISPFLYFFVLIVLMVLTPWFVMRAHAFNARNTAWRGLRFDFKGRYGGAAGPFLGWPLLLGCSMFLLFPFVTQRQKEYIIRHHAYGAARFELATELGDFFKAFLLAALFFLPVVGAYVSFIVFSVAAVARGENPEGGPPMVVFNFMFFVLLGVVWLCTFLGTQFWRARVFNIVWNGTSVRGHRFIATMRARDLILLQLVNVLVSLLTLGFMHPWGVMRKVRFQLSCLQVVPAGDLDAFVAESQPAGSAIGDAAGDMFDFDVGFGV